MNQLRIFWTFFRLGAMNELAYRVNFIAQFFQAILAMVFALGGLAVVFNQTDTLGGWRPARSSRNRRKRAKRGMPDCGWIPSWR